MKLKGLCHALSEQPAIIDEQARIYRAAMAAIGWE
jgi:hypothetical protein